MRVGLSYGASRHFTLLPLGSTPLCDLLRRSRGFEREGRGSFARAIARDLEANGGYVTEADLAEYEAVDARVVRGTYRGYELVGSDVPAAGSISIQGLHILETFDRSEYAPEEWAALAGQAIALASRELGGLGSDTARRSGHIQGVDRRTGHPGQDSGLTRTRAARMGGIRARRASLHDTHLRGRCRWDDRRVDPDGGAGHGLEGGDPRPRLPLRCHTWRTPR